MKAILIFMMLVNFWIGTAWALEVVKVKGAKAQILEDEKDKLEVGNKYTLISGSNLVKVEVAKKKNDKAIVKIIDGELLVGSTNILKSSDSASSEPSIDFMNTKRRILIFKIGTSLTNTYSVKDKDVGSGEVNTLSPYSFGISLGQYQTGRWGYDLGFHVESDRTVTGLNFGGISSSASNGNNFLTSTKIIDLNANYGMSLGLGFSYFFGGLTTSMSQLVGQDLYAVGIQAGLGGLVGKGFNYELGFKSITGKTSDGVTDLSYSPLFGRIGYAIAF